MDLAKLWNDIEVKDRTQAKAVKELLVAILLTVLEVVTT